MIPPLNVKTKRRSLDMTQKQLAEAMGTDESTVRRWESAGCPEQPFRHLTLLAGIDQLRRKYGTE